MACPISWEKSSTNFVMIWFSIFIVNLKCQSFLDVEEISRMKYGVIISNDPVLFHEKVGENELIVSSKHGQQYICSLPDIQLNFGDEQKSPNAQFNLVTKILDEAFNGSCLVHHKGWWSYKVCHKDKVEQFHVTSGAKISAVTLLGVYESEDHWNVSINESEIKSGRMHNQKYTNGAVCDLTMKPRSTQVKYICGENNGIVQVDEPESCQYIVTISSLKLCSHPLFKKHEEYEHFNMVCSPSLEQEAYDKYVRKKSKKKSSEEKLEKETDTVENKKPDKNIFQDLKETANGLSMLFGSLFGDLTESMQKMASSPLKIENTAESSDKKQEIITRNEVLEDISENKKSSQYEKLGSAKTPLEEADLKDELPPEDTVENKLYSRKAQLSMEYAQLKKSAKEEIQMSKKILEKVQNHLDESETPVEKSEWEKVVELLTDNIGKFDKQMSVLDQQMTEIEQVEAETEKHLHIVDEELKDEKKLQNIANALKSTKTVKKSLIDHTAEKISKEKSKNVKASQNSLAASLKQLDKIYKIFQKGLSDAQEKAQPKELHKSDKTSRKVFDQLQEQDSEKSKTNLNEPVTDFNTKDTQNKDSIKTSDESLPKVEGKTYGKILEKDKLKENDEGMLEIKFGVQSFDDLPNDLGDDDETFGAEKSANDIEEAVKKQLQDAGFKMNDNIKIKIITSKEKFDKYTANSKVLSTSTSLDFKDLLMGLLGNNKEKESEENRYNTLQNNYDTIWDLKEEEENEEEKKDLRNAFN